MVKSPQWGKRGEGGLSQDLSSAYTTFLKTCFREDLGLPFFHRSRIELKDKAKVVVSDWGTESLPR